MSPQECSRTILPREARRRCAQIGYSGLLGVALLAGRGVNAAPAVPILETIFPAGGQAGKTIDVTITGKNLAGLSAVQCSAPGVHGEILEANQVRLALPANTLPGLYDVWAISESGISAPRTIFIGDRQ